MITDWAAMKIETIVNCIIDGVEYDGVKVGKMRTGVNVLPDFKMDTADRNRTSPFAFTGNKFEFRMLGSSMSISTANVILNTIVADVIREFADRLEACDDFESEVDAILKETFTAHSRIIFSGNNYSEDWVREAQSRGLLNLKSTVDVLSYFDSEKNIELFERNKIFNGKEVHARCEIAYENYAKTLNIEANTMLDMAKRDILPAVMKYSGKLADTLVMKKKLDMDISTDAAKISLDRINALCSRLSSSIDKLDADMSRCPSGEDMIELAMYFNSVIIPDMNELRASADKLETIVDSADWPFPVYSDLMFNI